MKITHKNKIEVKFEDIKYGECLQILEKVYMKAIYNNIPVVVDLESGDVIRTDNTLFENYTIYRVKNIEVVIDNDNGNF